VACQESVRTVRNRDLQARTRILKPFTHTSHAIDPIATANAPGPLHIGAEIRPPGSSPCLQAVRVNASHGHRIERPKTAVGSAPFLGGSSPRVSPGDTRVRTCGRRGRPRAPPGSTATPRESRNALCLAEILLLAANGALISPRREHRVDLLPDVVRYSWPSPAATSSR
jgi:hypothetical protein